MPAEIPYYGIFSDNGHDTDDLIGRKYLQYGHKKGLLKVLFEVVQLTCRQKQLVDHEEYPEFMKLGITKEGALNDRAKITSGDNIAFGITDIPVAHGDPAEEADWEYHPSYEAFPDLVQLADRHAELLHLGKAKMMALMEKIFRQLKKESRSMILVVLTNFQQLEAVRKYIDNLDGGNFGKFEEFVSEIHIQNSLRLPKELAVGNVRPDDMNWEWECDVTAANVDQHPPSAMQFFEWARGKPSPKCYVYSKGAAMAVKFPHSEYYNKIGLGTFKGEANTATDHGKVQAWFQLVHTKVAWEYFRDTYWQRIPKRNTEWYLKYIGGTEDQKQINYWKKELAQNLKEGAGSAGEKMMQEVFEEKLFGQTKIMPYDPLACLGALRKIKGFEWSPAYIGLKGKEAGNKYYLGENYNAQYYKEPGDIAEVTKRAKALQKHILTNLKTAFDYLKEL